MSRPTRDRTSLSPASSDAYETLAARDDARAEPRPLPSPDELPVSAQTALASVLAAARRPFAPSIAHLATEHLTLFIELRAMGAHWPQIADLLFEQGLFGPTGKNHRQRLARDRLARTSYPEELAGSHLGQGEASASTQQQRSESS